MPVSPSVSWEIKFQVSTGLHWFSGFKKPGVEKSLANNNKLYTVSNGVVGHTEPNWPSCHQNCSRPLGFFSRAIIGYNEVFDLLHMKKE